MKEEELLESGVSNLQLDVSMQQRDQLLCFLRFLQKWNKAYNLTAITDLKQMVTHHLLDSLAVLPFIKGSRILDIGTGAGFPGVPLAICLPDKQFVLLDSNGKKIRFLQQAIIEFGFKNITLIHSRVEKFSDVECFDAIIMRAVSAIPEMLPKIHQLLCSQGQFLAMKGTFPTQELKTLNPQKITVQKLSIPGLEAERHLVIVEKD